MYIHPDREMRRGCYRNKETLMFLGRTGGEWSNTRANEKVEGPKET